MAEPDRGMHWKDGNTLVQVTAITGETASFTVIDPGDSDSSAVWMHMEDECHVSELTPLARATTTKLGRPTGTPRPKAQNRRDGVAIRVSEDEWAELWEPHRREGESRADVVVRLRRGEGP